MNPQDRNQELLDAWTAAHFGMGALMGGIGLGLGGTLVVVLGWELYEAFGRGYDLPWFEGSPMDAPRNYATDVAAALAGWGAANAIRNS